jgi:MFS family permease
VSRQRIATVQLILGVSSALVTSIFLAAPPFLIPTLTRDLGLDLATAGFIAVLPNLGLVSMLVIWGGLADRFGEREVLLAGLGLTTVAAFGAVSSSSPTALGIWLLLGGMASASANVATGRIVIGWTPLRRRGLVMGIRQMAIPLGVMVAATAVPPLAQAHGISVAMLLPALACAVVLPWCLFGLRNPPRTSSKTPETQTAAPRNPYNMSGYLQRIHAGSTALAVPQFALQIFGLVWLMEGLGWSAVAAGAVVGTAQFLGAIGRVIVGAWSDSRGRMNVIRLVSAAGVVTLLLLGLSAYLRWDALAVGLFIIATCLSVADNGPAFTAVAEHAGPFWSGRALGIQNTMQHLAGFLVGPTVGALLEHLNFPIMLALLALAPAIALPLVPKRDQHYVEPS